jgi:hypothetical protein
MVAVRALPVDSLALIVKPMLSMNRKNPKLRSGISGFAMLGMPACDLSVSGGISLLSGEKLVEMCEQVYDSEDLLHEILAKYPDLLAGEQHAGHCP